MPKSTIFSIPDHNNFYCVQDNSINGYRILDHRKDNLYEVIAKTATTRSYFRIRRNDGVAVASIRQGKFDYKYQILGVNDELLSEIEIKRGSIILNVADEVYTAKAGSRAKDFVFSDAKSTKVMTIDKKIVSKHDNYHVVFVEKFPSLIAAVMAVIIDDVYHKGLLK